MYEQDIQGLLDELRLMTERFERTATAAGPHLNPADRSEFKRILLEAKSMINAELGAANEFALPLIAMTNLPGYGFFNPPSPVELQEAIGIVQGGLNDIRRKQHRPITSRETPNRAPYVELSRIAELQSISAPPWDTRRLVSMLQELNLAEANGMHMASAMLVRAITDHVPPIFGKQSFAEICAHHKGGSVEGRSFKASMKHLSESMKHIADAILHVHIRPSETLPTATQVDFKQSLDVLLGEVVRLLRSK